MAQDRDWGEDGSGAADGIAWEVRVESCQGQYEVDRFNRRGAASGR